MSVFYIELLLLFPWGNLSLKLLPAILNCCLPLSLAPHIEASQIFWSLVPNLTLRQATYHYHWYLTLRQATCHYHWYLTLRQATCHYHWYLTLRQATCHYHWYLTLRQATCHYHWYLTLRQATCHYHWYLTLRQATCHYHWYLTLRQATCHYHWYLTLRQATCHYHWYLTLRQATCHYHWYLTLRPATCHYHWYLTLRQATYQMIPGTRWSHHSWLASETPTTGTTYGVPQSWGFRWSGYRRSRVGLELYITVCWLLPLLVFVSLRCSLRGWRQVRYKGMGTQVQVAVSWDSPSCTSPQFVNCLDAWQLGLLCACGPLMPFESRCYLVFFPWYSSVGYRNGEDVVGFRLTFWVWMDSDKDKQPSRQGWTSSIPAAGPLLVSLATVGVVS